MPKITKRYAKCSSQRANPRVVIDLFEVNWKSALSGRVRPVPIADSYVEFWKGQTNRRGAIALWIRLRPPS